MTFLDTNAFYYVAELSYDPNINIDELLNYVRREEIALSIVSLNEFLVKYKASKEKLDVGLSFILENNFLICNNKYFQRKYDDILIDKNGRISYHSNLLSDNNWDRYVKKAIKGKIECESYFAWVVFILILFSSYYFYAENRFISDNYCFNDFIIRCYKMWSDSLEFFIEAFTNGYNSTECEKVVKNKMKDILELALCISLPLFDATKECKSYDEIKNVISGFKFMEEYQKQKFKINKTQNDTSITFLSKLARNYSKTIGEKSYLEYINVISSLLDNRFCEKDIKNYLLSIVKDCFNNGSPFMKNDILDAFILCGLGGGQKIITFDNGMKEYMKKYRGLDNYNDSLHLIASFYK